MSLETVNTKLEAYKLITDPSRLLALLFSKYGDIQEDYNIEIANQLIFNKASHFNIYFKEQNIFNDKIENIRRFYHKNESTTKIIKLNDYYKNYQSFFCKAIFADFLFANILKNYQDKKAEIFYKDNYGNSSLDKDEEKSKNLTNSSTFSSLDNITNNKTIFDKKYKNIIENEDMNKTLMLTLDSFLNKKNGNNEVPLDKGNLISVNTSDPNNEKDKSFIDCLKNFILLNKVKAKAEKKNNKEDNSKKNNNLNNSCKQNNDLIKNKLLNKKEDLDKSNKENSNFQNLISKTKFSYKTNTQLNRNNYNNNNNNENQEKIKIKKVEIEKKELNKINLILSPKHMKFNFANLTSRNTEFKKLKPINMKSTKKNKSYHFNNNKKHNQIISRNISQNSNNCISFPYPNKNNDFSTKILNDISLKKLKNSSNKNIQAIQSTISQISRYNQFLRGNNKPINNKKNKTYEILNNGNKMKNLSNKNNLFTQFKKLVNSHSQNNKVQNNNNLKSKFNLFKNGNFSPVNLNPINKNRNKNGLNNLQAYNKLINKSRNFEQYKKYMISSNSIDNNNIHISSLSPQSISQNLKLNKEKKNILNNIKIINKIKLPNRLNKNHIKDIINTNNYNINFNNLFFCGPNTPNYFDNIKNNIINNQNRHTNMNIKKVNANFYMLSFNNLNNSNQINTRNKAKISDTNYANSHYKIKNRTNDNMNIKNLRKCQSQKKYTNYKRKDIDLNKKKIPLTINKILVDK